MRVRWIVSMLTSTSIGNSTPNIAAICPDQAPAAIATMPQRIFPAAVSRQYPPAQSMALTPAWLTMHAPGGGGCPNQAGTAAQRNREGILGAGRGGADFRAQPGSGDAKRVALQEIDIDASFPLQGDRRVQHLELTLRHRHTQPAGTGVAGLELLIGGQAFPQFERHLHQVEDLRTLDLQGERAGIGARSLAPGFALFQDDDLPARPGQIQRAAKTGDSGSDDDDFSAGGESSAVPSAVRRLRSGNGAAGRWEAQRP